MLAADWFVAAAHGIAMRVHASSEQPQINNATQSCFTNLDVPSTFVHDPNIGG